MNLKDERAIKLGFESDSDYWSWWARNHRRALLLAVEIAGRDNGGWANCHEIADVLRRSKDTSRAATDPAYLSMSLLGAWCRPSHHTSDEIWLQKRRRIGAGLVDYKLTDEGRAAMKRSMTA